MWMVWLSGRLSLGFCHTKTQHNTHTSTTHTCVRKREREKKKIKNMKREEAEELPLSLTCLCDEERDPEKREEAPPVPPKDDGSHHHHTKNITQKPPRYRTQIDPTKTHKLRSAPPCSSPPPLLLLLLLFLSVSFVSRPHPPRVVWRLYGACMAPPLSHPAIDRQIPKIKIKIPDRPGGPEHQKM